MKFLCLLNVEIEEISAIFYGQFTTEYAFLQWYFVLYKIDKKESLKLQSA